jgi:hypothetical protein
MAPPRDPRKDASDALARRLADGEAAATASVRSSAAPESPASPSAVARDVFQRYTAGEPRPIGIWRPRRDGDTLVFERDDAALASEWWADAAVLRPKTSLLPLRVCLLGESTAAGWFYAPDLTPARVLEAQLRGWAGERTFEVIDLCMVNLQAAALVELLGSALQLAPDVVVVFAGNNWPTGLPVHGKVRPGDRERLAAAFQEAGCAGLAAHCAERSREQAERTLATLVRIADAAALPLVLVAPESNLVDWHRDRPAPWLAGDGSRAWHQAHRRTRRALVGGRAEEASRGAEAMLALDHGVCPTSWRLAGAARLALGQLEPARDAFEAAVEARAWDNHPSTPSATRVVRDAMIRAGQAHGLPLVDLRTAFREAGGGRPPGRRLFLDYCHLTAEGMRLAMAEVAVRVLALADPGRAPAGARDVLQRGSDLALDPQTEARARFLSALYGAHYGSGYDPETASFLGGPDPPVRHFLETALEAAPAVAETIRAWVETRTAPASALALSSAQQQFLGRLGRLERQSALGPGLDPELVAEACAALERRGLRPPEHGNGSAGGLSTLELVNPHFFWSASDARGQDGALGLEGHAYLRARWDRSHFCLPRAQPGAVRLLVTARLPRAPIARSGRLRLFVNDVAVGAIELTDRWERAVVYLSPDALQAGSNRVTLAWPELPAAGDEALDAIGRGLEDGRPVELHPVFGEVFSLRVQAAG